MVNSFNLQVPVLTSIALLYSTDTTEYVYFAIIFQKMMLTVDCK